MRKKNRRHLKEPDWVHKELSDELRLKTVVENNNQKEREEIFSYALGQVEEQGSNRPAAQIWGKGSTYRGGRLSRQLPTSQLDTNTRKGLGQIIEQPLCKQLENNTVVSVARQEFLNNTHH